MKLTLDGYADVIAVANHVTAAILFSPTLGQDHALGIDATVSQWDKNVNLVHFNIFKKYNLKFKMHIFFIFKNQCVFIEESKLQDRCFNSWMLKQ